MVVLTGPVVMVTGVVGRVTVETLAVGTKVRSVPPPPVVSAATAKLPWNNPDNVILLVGGPAGQRQHSARGANRDLADGAVAGARSVKSMTSLASRLAMVSPFRSAAVSRKMSLPALEPVSVLAPAPPVSTWPAPPAVMLVGAGAPDDFQPGRGIGGEGCRRRQLHRGDAGDAGPHDGSAAAGDAECVGPLRAAVDGHIAERSPRRL